MGKGIICKVWPISGDTEKKDTWANLQSSISYILCSEKTDIKLDNLSSFPESQLMREVKYVENDIKTLNGACVGAYNLRTTDIHEAVLEMFSVKRFFGKMDGRAALHGVISLDVEESNIENAAKLLQLCKDVLKEMFPLHQAIFAVHTNTDNLHVHFIVNSVGLNGKKIHQPNGFIKHALHPCVNKYAAKYGFTPNELWAIGSDKMGEFVLNKINMRRIIDMAIEDSESIEEFIDFIKMAGFKVNAGKHISLKTEDMAKAVRTHQLGPNYTKEAIVNRILTKRADLELSDVRSYANTEEPGITMVIQKGNLKKYKDMTESEKKKVVKLLREGKNPWRDNSTLNWALSKMQRDVLINTTAKKYINDYSSSGDCTEALNNIIELKKQLTQEKKLLKDNVRRYKPIIDIYKEMQKYAKQAFLYEYEHREEYRYEYEEYKDLNIRLKDQYNKTPEDIAVFLEETDNRILFAKSQINELSAQYRDIKKYAQLSGITTKAENLLDVMEYYSNKEKAEKYSHFSFGKYYIVTDNPSVILMVDCGVGMNSYGKNFATYKVSFISKDGEVVKTLTNEESEREFPLKIREMEKKYKLRNAKKFFNADEAIDTLNRRNKDVLKRDYKDITEEIKNLNKDKHPTWSFTSVINLGCTTDIGDEYYCINSDLSLYTMKVITKIDQITIEVYEQDEYKESYSLPRLEKANENGWAILTKIKKTYGFSDDMLAFKSDDLLRSYINENKNIERTYSI